MEKLESLVARLEKAVAQLEGGAKPSGAAPSSGGGDDGALDSASFKAYNDWIESHVVPFVQLSTKLGTYNFVVFSVLSGYKLTPTWLKL